MSTTVIASKAGLSLFLAPWASGQVDMEALNKVLRRHGLQTQSEAQPGVEFIAAEGLEAQDAETLAEELRAIGLTVRIRRRTGLERSSRVAQAFGLLTVAGTVVMMGSLPLIESQASPIWLAVPALVLGLIIANTLSLARRGGNTLKLLTKPAQVPGQVSQALLEMREELPDALFTRLLTQAQDLEAKVAKNPDGQAAQELEELAASLRERNDAEVANEVSALRQELDQARKAIAEAKRPRPRQKH